MKFSKIKIKKEVDYSWKIKRSLYKIEEVVRSLKIKTRLII